MKKWAIITGNEVINTVLWDGVTEWEYPFPHDEMVEVTDELRIGIGWWKDEQGVWNEPIPIPNPEEVVEPEY